MRIIEVITNHGHVDTLRGIAAQQEIVDIWVGHNDEDDRCNTRLLVLPVEATLPRIKENDSEDEKQNKITRSRE